MSWFYPAFLVALFGQCFADLSSEYNHFVALDPAQKMKLYWTVNRTREEISFAVEASTTGWVGFGFSAGTGRMMGADIVIGWVKGGKPYLTDRHGEGHFLPTMDQSQDYKLISGTEKDGKTTLKFSRKIDTCDKNDIKIEEGTTKVIFGYSDEDPTSDLQINKHSYRDARSILLLNFGKTSQPDPSWEKMEFLMDNITVPEIKTSYMCKVFKLPDFVGKRHIVRFDPVVQPGNEGFVHHFVVNECQGSFPVHLLNFTSNCLDYANMPQEVLKCKVTNILAGWGVGGGPFVYPEHVGYPIGMNNSARVIIVEIHYDNPEKIKGRLDSSGVRFYYTSDIRKYDVGLLSVGVDVTSWMVIPPKQDNWIVTGYCKKECTQKALESSGIPGKGIVLFSSFLHTHLAGSGAWTQHVRDGVQLQDIARDNYYDFNFQETQLLRKEIHFKPGDELIHQCKYNTLNRDKTTFGGVQTTDEMCINLLMYYPRIEGLTVSCSSNNLPATYKFLEKHYPNSKVHSHKWYNPLLHVKPKWTPRLVADYRAFLEKEEKISTCVKIANVTSFADVVNPKNLRDKVVINKPYVPPPSACDVYSSSKALRVGLVNVVLSAWIVGAALILL